VHFFLYEIVARVVAVYLGVDCGRKIWRGFRDRKIANYNSDLLDWWSNWIFSRDTEPVSYWTTIGIQAFALFACVFVAIFGWGRP
jgi:hypothetical protein